MLSAVIVDDEILVLHLLKEILKKNQVKLIGEYTNPQTAKMEIPKLKPDVVFLDIEMPGMNGIELAAELSEEISNANIVFVTAYDNYAIAAFKLNALHYILKPPEEEEIQQALSRVEHMKKFTVVKENKNIYVHLFGNVTIEDESRQLVLKWPTQKTEELFSLFVILGEKGIDKWSIIEKLWPDYPSSNVEHLLYTTVYRMKKTLEEVGIQVIIKNRLGYYTFHLNNTWCDVKEFEKIEKSYKNGTLIVESLHQELFDIYQGSLFGSRDYFWGKAYQSAFQNTYENICDYLIGVYKKRGESKKAEEIFMKKQLYVE